jgi:hypothetical protein
MTDLYREDIFGKFYEPTPDISGMTSPVRCTHCPGVYDLGTVTVTARYTDCSMWRSPCCDVLVDDRGETGWKSRGDYVRINRAAE